MTGTWLFTPGIVGGLCLKLWLQWKAGQVGLVHSWVTPTPHWIFYVVEKNGMFQFDGCSPSGNLHSTPWFEIVVLLKKKHDSRDRSWLGKMVLGAKNLPPVGGQVHVVPLDPQDRGIFCLPSLHSSGFRILGYVQKNPSLTGIGSRTSGVLEMIPPPLTWNGYPLVWLN